MDGLIGLGMTLALMLVLAGLMGATERTSVSWRWLVAAVLIVALNDVLLTSAYGMLPNFLPGLERNWQGKLLALGGTLAIAAHPAVGWHRVGLTFAHEPGSLKAAIAILYCAFFVMLALIFPNGEASAEDISFQLTMPGLEEEAFFRGLLLFALSAAFAGRRRFLGVEWNWGAVLSCWLFGMVHAFSISDGSASFDPLSMALTALPSFVAIWLRLRTGSLVMPIVLHNFGNSIMMTL